MIHRLVVLAMLFGILGCGNDAGPAPGERVARRDSAGVEIVDNPATPTWAPEEVWSVEEIFSIGQLDGPAEYTLNRVGGVAIGPAGELFVLDSGDHVVRVYSEGGVFLRSFGGEGDGPGEFRAAALILLQADTVVVLDWRLHRLTRFGLDGTLIRTDRTDMTPFEYGFPEHLAVLPEGTFIVSTGTGCALRREGDNMWKLFTMTPEGEVSDTLRILQRGDLIAVYGEEPNMFCTSVALSFGPPPSMAVASDGQIALGDGASYEISVFRLSREADPPAWVLDEPHRIVRRTVDPEAATDADIQHLRDAYARSSNAPDYLADGVQKAFDEYDFPDRWPAFVRLMFDAEGHLWAERPGRDAQDPRATANWDVFAPDGTYLGEVSLPGSTRVLAISSDRVIAVLTDELDVPYLKGYRINR